MASRAVTGLIGGLLGLVAVLVVVLYLPFMQEVTARTISNIIRDSTGLDISFRRLEIPLMDQSFKLHDILILDQDDTILAVKQLAVEIDFRRLTYGALHIEDLYVQGVRGGVSMVGDSLYPIDILLETFQSGSSETTAQPLDVSIGRIRFEDVRAYWYATDPSMHGSIQNLTGTIEQNGGHWSGSYEATKLEYIVMTWPFHGVKTRGEISISDRLQLDGSVQTDMPAGTLDYTLEIDFDTGDFSMDIAGKLDTGIVNSHFTAYPDLAGDAALQVQLGYNSAFWLNTELQVDGLQYEEDLVLKDAFIAMHMSEEEMWFDSIKTHFKDSFLDANGWMRFGPPTLMWFAGDTSALDLALVDSAFVPVPVDGWGLRGRYDGAVRAEIDVMDTEEVFVRSQLSGVARNLEFIAEQGTLAESWVAVTASADVDVNQGKVEIALPAWNGRESDASGWITRTTDGLYLHGQAGIDLHAVQLPGVGPLEGQLQMAGKGTPTGTYVGSLNAVSLLTSWNKYPLQAQAQLVSNGRKLIVRTASVEDQYGGVVEGEATVDLGNRSVLGHVHADDFGLQTLALGAQEVSGQVDLSAGFRVAPAAQDFSIDLDSLEIDSLFLQGPVQGSIANLVCKSIRPMLHECVAEHQLMSSRVRTRFVSGYGVEQRWWIDHFPLAGFSVQNQALSGSMSGNLALDFSDGRMATDWSLEAKDLAIGAYVAGGMRSDGNVENSRSGIALQMSMETYHPQQNLAFAIQLTPDRHIDDSYWAWFDVGQGSTWLSQFGLPWEPAFRGQVYSRMRNGEPFSPGFQLEELHVYNGPDMLLALHDPVRYVVHPGRNSSPKSMDFSLIGVDGARAFDQRIQAEYSSAGEWKLGGDVRVPVDIFGPLIPEIELRSGSLLGSFELGMHSGNWHMDGMFDLDRSELSLPSLGIVGDILSGTVRLQDSTLFVSDVILQNQIGTIDLSAAINLWEEFALAADLQMHGLRILPANGVQADISGPLRIRFPRNDTLLVTGKLQLDNALLSTRIDWEKSLYKFQTRSVERLKEVREDAVWLDIIFLNDAAVRVENNLATAVIDGDFRMVGPASNFGLLGNLSTESGALFWRGQVYQIENGLAQFTDAEGWNPQVDVRATTRVEERTDDAPGVQAQVYSITLHAYGRLRDLIIDYSSDPFLQKEEIFSLLNFGVADITANQTELTSLLLGSQISQIESEIEELVGFDRFELQPAFNSKSQSSTMTVRMSKRFTDKIGLRVESSIDRFGEQSVGLDYGISQLLNLSLGWDNETETNEIGNFSLQPRLRIPLP